MCGILLALHRGPEAVHKGLRAMSYRGTLEPMACQLGDWTLGHIRLPVQTKEEDGVQPFSTMGGGVAAFVGEIFSPGGRSEFEEIEDAIHDPDRFHSLDGFWSIVSVRETYATVITDFLGIKPLYYWVDQGIVCSEIHPMFHVTGFPAPLDETYLSNCIKWGYDYSGRTPYKGIIQLAPGMEYSLSAMGYSMNSAPSKYWDFNRVIPRVALDVTDSANLLQSMLTASVINRINHIADLPGRGLPSMLLSGGLDSSIIYAIAKQAGLKFTPYFIDNEEDELYLPDDPGIVKLGQKYGQGAGGLTSEFNEKQKANMVASIMQAPVDLGSVIPQQELAAAIYTETSHPVVLTGDGADELFGGYRRSRDYDSQASDVFCELPYYHLPRLDRVHMRWTQEVRSPFLAPRVIATALRLPVEARTGKAVLKQVARNLGVPEKVINRPKTPLKSTLVKDGGVHYRKLLVSSFRDNHTKMKEFLYADL